MRRNATAARCALLLASTLPAGCITSTQRVHIQCVPEQVKIYVDGRQLEEGELEISLRTDEPHKVFVKGPGYEPQLVVLVPETDAEGHQSLGPEDVCIEVVPMGMDRELELHPEHDVPDTAPEH